MLSENIDVLLLCRFMFVYIFFKTWHGGNAMFYFCTRIVYFQVAKKLAGHATGTAAWATNVGKKHGQVLMRVLTAAEGTRLMDMAAGIQRRYETAGQSPPTPMYVDRDCCSSTGTSAVAHMFCRWPDLAMRPDVRHFIRRFRSA